MKKVLVLYFSGAGSSKKVAELMYENIKDKCDAQICAIDATQSATDQYLNSAVGLIIGTPVYHSAPSCIVTDYFNGISALHKKTPAFLYNTRALWACNTNRILAQNINKKNIVTIMDRAYRSPASDGSLIVPFVKRFFEFQHDLDIKVATDCNRFLQLLETEQAREYIPRFRISSIINAPNKLAGQLITFHIYLHPERCVHCGICAKNCPHNVITMDKDGDPVWTAKKCENCYRCIHHCPGKALSLSKWHAPEKLLRF